MCSTPISWISPVDGRRDVGSSALRERYVTSLFVPRRSLSNGKAWRESLKVSLAFRMSTKIPAQLDSSSYHQHPYLPPSSSASKGNCLISSWCHCSLPITACLPLPSPRKRDLAASDLEVVAQERRDPTGSSLTFWNHGRKSKFTRSESYALRT